MEAAQRSFWKLLPSGHILTRLCESGDIFRLMSFQRKRALDKIDKLAVLKTSLEIIQMFNKP